MEKGEREIDKERGEGRRDPIFRVCSGPDESKSLVYKICSKAI